MFKISQFFNSSPAQEHNGNTKSSSLKANSFDNELKKSTPNPSRQANIGKNIILNRSEKVIGYQFLPLGTVHEKLNQSSKVRALYDSALLMYIHLFEAKEVFNKKIVSIKISSTSLNNSLLDKITPQNILLVIDLLEPEADWNLLNSRLIELREKGFLLALSIREDIDSVPPITVTMDYIAVDVASFIGLDLRLLINNIYARNYMSMDTQLIAENIQSHEDFQFCYKVGFNLFDGPFIANNKHTKVIKNAVNSTIVFSVLQLLRTDSNFEEIAQEIKNEPTVTYKLLRYANSAAMGLSRTIDSLTEALMIIGTDKLYRWISLLLFDFERSGYYENILVEKALVRARTLELLSGKGAIPNQPDQLFLVGLFSLLDKVLGQSLIELVDKASLPEDVRNALVTNSGLYADALHLAVLGEANSYTSDVHYRTALACCSVTDADYASASLSAVVWADQALSNTN